MWYFIIGISLTIMIGFSYQLYSAKKLSIDYEKVEDYFEKLTKIIKQITLSNGIDNTLYSELISKSEEIQLIIQFYGVIDLEEYGRIYRNYPLVLNAVPKIKELITNTNTLDAENLCKEIDMLQNGFLRYFNNIHNIMNKYKKSIFNPFICLVKGIQFIMFIPFNILYWIGLISEKSIGRIEKNLFFKLLSGIGALLTIVSTIMTIVLGWDEFIKIIKGFLNFI